MFELFEGDSDASNIPRLRISLRIHGDTLDPEYLTQQLGISPSFSARRGDPFRGDDGSVHDSGVWVYRLDVPPDTDLGGVIALLLDRFPEDSTLWEEVTTSYGADIFCGVFLQADSQSTVVDAEVLTRLARLGLPLSFEFYAPSDAEPADTDDGAA